MRVSDSVLEQAVIDLDPRERTTRATDECEEVLFVVAGTGELRLDGERHVLQAETGVNLAPGQEYELHNVASDPMRMISVRIHGPAPAEGPAEALAERPAERPAEGPAEGPALGNGLAGAPAQRLPDAAAVRSPHAAAERPPDAAAEGPPDAPPDGPPEPTGRVVVRRLADQEAHAATTERTYRIVADPSTGLRSATHFVGYVPTERAPEHFHTYDEVIYVLDGEGEFHAGGEHTRLGPGSCIELPARTVHCLENTGHDVLRLVAVFRPAGSPAAAYYPDGTPAYPGTPVLTT